MRGAPRWTWLTGALEAGVEWEPDGQYRSLLYQVSKLPFFCLFFFFFVSNVIVWLIS